jgi:L-rhamnose mutarotase
LFIVDDRQSNWFTHTLRESANMQRVCFLLQVKPDRLIEYKKAHKEVWPNMLAALSRHGWSNYSLFLKSDGLLVGYVETPDFKKAVDGMQTEEVNHQWQAAMKDFLMTLGNGAADVSLEILEEVFHLD